MGGPAATAPLICRLALAPVTAVDLFPFFGQLPDGIFELRLCQCEEEGRCIVNQVVTDHMLCAQCDRSQIRFTVFNWLRKWSI
jgi:hypothetical protein